MRTLWFPGGFPETLEKMTLIKLYETFIDENNEVFSTGEIIYANLVLRGQSDQLFLSR